LVPITGEYTTQTGLCKNNNWS